jgi:glycopeptide antibiotics resistance protein
MFSAAIEITQYFTGRGLCEFDDVFHNTLGACIGFIIWKKLSH